MLKYLITFLLVFLPIAANAQVFKINQLTSPQTPGLIVSNGIGTSTLTASSSPTISYLFATSTTATSTFLGKLKLGSFSALPQIIGPDEDTGIHFDGPDILSFHTGGQTRMLINGSGDIGIATSSPFARLSVVGSVVAERFSATSTAATSTFQGNVVLSPDGQNPFGFAVGPLVVEGPLAGPYQTIITNTLDSSVSLAGITIGNSRFRNPGFSADYYCGFYIAAPSYDLAGFNGVIPNGGALFCKDGPITIGSATSTAGPEIRFQATGMDSGNVDAVIEGSTGNFGIGTTSPFAKLSIHPLATDTQRTLFAIASSTAIATSTHMIVLNNGRVGISTTSPSGRFAVTYDPTLSAAIRREFFILNGVGLVNRYDHSASDNMRLQNFFGQASSTIGSTIQFDLSAQSGGVVTQLNAGSIAVIRTQDWTGTASTRTSAITFSTRDGASGVIERMRIGPEGNVGIGTTTPIGRLDVSGTSASTNLITFDANRMISVINTNTTANNAQGIAFRSVSVNGTTQSGVKLLGVNTARTTSGLTSDFAILTNTDGTISEKMRVTSGGRVGIGTTTPSAVTHIANPNPIPALLVEDDTSPDPSPFIIDAIGNVGIGTTTATSKLSVVGDTGVAGTLRIQVPTDAMNTSRGISIIPGVLTGDQSIVSFNNTGGRLIVGSHNTGGGTTTATMMFDPMSRFISFNTATSTTAGAIERVRIDGNGNLGIGTTTPSTTLSINGSTLISATTTSSGYNLVGGCFAKNGSCLRDEDSFTYSTTTAWTGTTTIPLGTAYTAERWAGIQCFTDVGTLWVAPSNSISDMNYFQASTTVGTITLTTNTTFTAAEKRYVKIGNPASSPTSISCTAAIEK